MTSPRSTAVIEAARSGQYSPVRCLLLDADADVQVAEFSRRKR